MSLLPVSAIPVVDTGYNINNSLRFRQSVTANLTRTPASNGSRTTMTYSVWIKGMKLDSTYQDIFSSNASGGTGDEIGFRQQNLYMQTNGNTGGTFQSTALYRDPSAWYHIVVVFDTTQATSTNRLKAYVNGVQITSFSSITYPALNAQVPNFNTTTQQMIGAGYNANGGSLDGYLAEVYFIDGQALTPSSFGETDTTTGVWKPKAYTGTYGTNGFYLPFSNTSTVTALGYDASTSTLKNQSVSYVANASGSSTNTSVTVTIPTVSVNDFLVLTTITRDGSNISVTDNDSGSWTEQSSVTIAAGGISKVFTRFATSATSAKTITLTLTGSTDSNAALTVYSGVNLINPITSLSSASLTAGTNSTSSVTTTAYTNLLLSVAIRRTGLFSGETTATLGAMTERIDTSSTNTTIMNSTLAVSANGTSGTISWTAPTPGAASGVHVLQLNSLPGNNWTPTGISLTSGSTYDAMTDSPTLSASASNYATLDPNAKASSITLSEGNLKSVDSSGSFTVCVFATQTVSNKCYWEFQITNVGVSNVRGACGVLPSNYTPTTLAPDSLTAGVAALGPNSVGMLPQVSAIYQNGATTGISTGAWVANDVVMMAYDNGKLWMGRNGTWANSGNPAAGTGEVASGLDTSALPVICNRNSQTWIANFGQRPFAYTPPTGFVGLNTYNLPDSTIKKGNSYMDATTYTGNGGATQTITNAAGFKPDFVWVKCRSVAYRHGLFDSVRGVGVSNTTDRLQSNATDAQDGGPYMSSLNSNGFTITNYNATYTENGQTYVGWQWKAGQGTTSSNTNGSITSTVSVNATAGFSVVTYTGTGANATVGHGLGVAPSMIIIKNRSSGVTDWPFYHSVAGPLNILYLNSTSAYITVGAAGVWNSTAPSSTVFSIGTNSRINVNGNNFVAYCWAEIAGFSKFGSYTGNGSANGPVVYLGFRPKYLMIKQTNTTANWHIIDSSRNLYNVVDLGLKANLTDAESAGSSTLTPYIDFLANGFKLRTNQTQTNASGGNFIYVAFAENPFKNSLAR